MNDTITVAYRVTEQDFRRATRLWYSTRRMIVVDVVLSAGMGMVALADPFVLGEIPRIIFLALGFGFLALLPIGLYVAPTLRVRRDPRFQTSYVVTFSEADIQTASDLGESRLSWDFFTRARYDSATCLLYYAANQFMTVPLRAFASDAERTRFLDLIRRKIAKVEQQ